MNSRRDLVMRKDEGGKFHKVASKVNSLLEQLSWCVCVCVCICRFFIQALTRTLSLFVKPRALIERQPANEGLASVQQIFIHQRRQQQQQQQIHRTLTSRKLLLAAAAANGKNY